MSFPDTIRHLGRKFGIEVEDEEPTPEALAAAKDRDSLFAVVEYATRKFESNLRETEEGTALGLGYFRSRGFRDDTIATFRLGYSLNKRDAFMSQAIADGYKEEYLLKAGLIYQNEETGYKSDKFWGRVIFPIQNAAGKVIAFGGRVLDARTKGVAVKYINSPETELYVKSDVVYGIHQARTEMSRRDKCYLVEGYTDVISMYQSGIPNVVASSGTALTVNQIKLIQRYTQNITVLYDGDKAGVEASLRGIDMILHEGMNARVLLLPDNDDPDSFSRKHTAEEFQKYVEENETDFISFEAERLMAIAANDPIKKANATHTMIKTISEVQDIIKREFYVKECSKIMSVSEAALFSDLQKVVAAKAVRQREKDIAERRRQNGVARGHMEVPQPINAAPIPEGLSPSEMTILQKSSRIYDSSRKQASEKTLNQETEFREVMRFFVMYAQSRMEKTEDSPTVADYIISAIDCDGLVSSDSVIMRVLDEYRKAEDKSKIDSTYYINMPDAEISSFVAHAIGGRQELSSIHKKSGGTIYEESELLDELVPRAVDELRMKHIIIMIEETMAELKTKSMSDSTSEEEISGLMEKLRDLNEIKREFSLEMGERAVVK